MTLEGRGDPGHASDPLSSDTVRPAALRIGVEEDGRRPLSAYRRCRRLRRRHGQEQNYLDLDPTYKDAFGRPPMRHEKAAKLFIDFLISEDSFNATLGNELLSGEIFDIFKGVEVVVESRRLTLPLKNVSQG
jgi:hypothetical protein